MTRDKLLVISGLTPEQKGGDNIDATAILYCVQDSTIVALKRGNDAPIDTAYVSEMAKRFVELKVYEIRADDGIVMIQIDEKCHNRIARFGNESVLKKYNKENRWKQFIKGWYLTINSSRSQ